MTRSLIVDVVARVPILNTSKSITNSNILKVLTLLIAFCSPMKANRVSLMLHSKFTGNDLQLADVVSPLVLNLLHLTYRPFHYDTQPLRL
jgi:hypothetical protein